MEDKIDNGRRSFIKTAARAGLVTGISAGALPSLAHSLSGAKQRVSGEKIGYKQAPLPYAYTMLEPAIDALTMEIHYSKHAAGYAKNLDEAVKAEGVNPATTSLEEILANISRYSIKMRNNAGGHYNHELFWKSMGKPGATQPGGSLLQAIVKDFNSLDAFKIQFADAGKSRFGSGWAWLVLTPEKKLVIGSSPNQDNPLMGVSELKGIPLLGLDVWEHAYYLKYQNRRPDYINAWWTVVDWGVIQKRFGE